jgi:hypothetical protein
MHVEKIHDIRRHLGSQDDAGFDPGMRKLMGVINHRLTRIVAFVLIAITLAGCTVACLLALWGYVAPDYAWRGLASLGIVSAAAAIFVALNEGFGPSVRKS